MITQAELKKLVDYNQDTGKLIWKVSPVGPIKVGDSVGKKPRLDGYIRTSINKERYYVHRLVWLYIHGYFPEHQIDHIDGHRSNNRADNLRHVTSNCNMQNQKVYRNNTSGFPGVYSERNLWAGHLRISSKGIYLGSYTDPLEAALARYTCEVWHPGWQCNHRSKLTQAIKAAWPDFRPST